MTTGGAATPDLTVVIADNGTPGAVDRCLAALAPQAAGVELVVCLASEEAEPEHGAWPDVVRLTRPGARVPELWRDGIRAAGGRAVALTISPMLPAPDWVDALRRGLGRADVVGGAVEPADGLRLADRAEYLNRYARDMLPFVEHPCLDLPGDNAAYPRALLDAVAETWAAGFVEPHVHRALAERGATLLHDPAIVVRMGRSAGFRPFLRQRFAHGREFAALRGVRASRAANLAFLAAAPVVPLLLVARTAREVGARRRRRLDALWSLPVLLAYDVAWAAGEAAGRLDALRGR